MTSPGIFNYGYDCASNRCENRLNKDVYSSVLNFAPPQENDDRNSFRSNRGGEAGARFRSCVAFQSREVFVTNNVREVVSNITMSS